MTKEGFNQYLEANFTKKDSRAASSYYTAINILDKIFLSRDVFGLKGTSLCCIEDLELLLKISDFVKTEEAVFRLNEGGFFSYGSSRQKSYPKGRFCSAAMKSLIGYYENEQHESAHQVVLKAKSGLSISKKLDKLFGLNDKSGEDVVRETKARIGQDYFRKMILENYDNKCWITGLEVTPVLRASHIVAWSDDKKNRLNPENGICLSATYDAAFDKHLISFDKDYKLIVSNEIKDHYTSDVAKEYFLKKEGMQMILPSKFPPNQEFLEKHRELLVG